MEPKQELGAFLKLENQLFVVGSQGCAAFVKDRTVALGVPRVRDWACRVLRSGLWVYRGLPPGSGGACSQGWESRSGRVEGQIAQNGLHVQDVVHVCAGGSCGVPLPAGAGETRVVGPSHVRVGNVSLSHVDVAEKVGREACTGVEIDGVGVQGKVGSMVESRGGSYSSYNHQHKPILWDNKKPRRGGAAVPSLTLTRRRFEDANCERSWCRMSSEKGRRGIGFAWRQHRFFFVDFLLLALSYQKLEETGKEEEEQEHGGGVKLTEVALLQHCCCALFWTSIYGTYKERSPDDLHSHER